MYRHTASPVLLWPKVSGLRSGCPLSNLSVSLCSTRPGCGSQRLLRCRLHPAGRGPNSSSLFPPLAAVVAVAPGRGASGEEARLSGMPRPPIGRGGGTASAVTERLSPAEAFRVSLHLAITYYYITVISPNCKRRGSLIKKIRYARRQVPPGIPLRGIIIRRPESRRTKHTSDFRGY